MKELFKIAKQNASDINEHLDILVEYGNRCEKIVEFGVRWADGSTVAFLNTDKHIVVESYDIKEFDPGRIEYLQSICDQNGKPWKFELKSSLDVDIDTDMLFIDTYHTYKQLKLELERHHSNVKKYIVLHDTTTFANRDEFTNEVGGLLPALDEFLKSHAEWKIVYKVENCNGLTILSKES